MPIITVQFIKDVVATPEQKRELLIRLTDKFVGIVGEVTRPFVYCIIKETPQAEWGIAGVPMPDLVYLTGDKHAQVIARSNDMMRSAIAQMQQQGGAPAETSTNGTGASKADRDRRADEIWRGAANPAGAGSGGNGRPAARDEDEAAQRNAAAAEAERARVRRNRDVIHQFYQAVNAKRREEFYSLVHPDFVNHGGAAGDIKGVQALIDSLDPFYTAMPDWHVSEDYVVAQGDRVASRGTITGTHLGQFMGAQPTGKKVSWTGMIIYRLDDDGRIVERWQDFDALSMLQQLGVMPAPEPVPAG